MAEELALAVFLSTIVTSVAYLEYRYNQRKERVRHDRLAQARLQDRLRGTAKEGQLLRETRLQHAVQRTMSYAVSVFCLCTCLALVSAGLLAPPS